MNIHPAISTSLRKFSFLSLLLLGIIIQWGMLMLYIKLSPTISLADSVISILLWGIFGFLSWFLSDYVRIWTARIAVALAVQIIWISLTFSFLYTFGIETYEIFTYTIPLRLVYGLLSWFLLFQWYENQITTEEENLLIQESLPTKDTTKEIVDRISVKDGSRIHIIHPDEILYIQASRDYVTFFTENGQYVKVQTMKYFEIHLPDNFIRIHRSTIVNIDYIQRIELFGKETYHIRLKNGAGLKASITGYKLLKNRLNL